MKKNRRIMTWVLAITVLQTVFVTFGLANAVEQTWGPERSMFTWDKPADHVTFNSIKDNPFIGDETNFVRVKEYVAGGENGGWVDNVTVEPGKEYEVFIYIHNNASASLNDASGKGLALNTRVASSFPTKLKAGDSGVIRGSVSASNASPVAVWDTAFFKADQTVYISYVDNTAVLHSSENCKTTDGTILSADAFFASSEEIGKDDKVGAMIACYNRDDLWGVIPGCNEYAGYVTYRVRVDQPGFWTEKTVSKVGEGNYVEYLNANPGDALDFKIYYKNTGTTNQMDVVAHDTIPKGMTYVSGSVQVTTPIGTETLTPAQEAKLFADNETDSLIIGDFRPGEEATITYQVKLLPESDFECGEHKLYNDATIQTINGSQYDKVQIIVNKDCGGDKPSEEDCKTNPNMEGCQKNCKTNPEMEGCQELPSTGPLEIVMAVIVIIGIGGGGYYLYRTRKTLNKVESNAKGDNSSKNKAETKQPQEQDSQDNTLSEK